jgi:hypothetical protein
MTTEILKKYIFENTLEVTEAIWLSKKLNLQATFSKFSESDDKANLEILLQSINEVFANTNVSFEDELFLFSIKHKIETYITLSEENEDYEDEEDDDDFFNPNSKESLAKLKIIEDNIFALGHDAILKRLIEFIQREFPKTLNGFNKLEYQRAKSAFWKSIGFEQYSYYSLSKKMERFLDKIYNESEPIVKRLVEQRELNMLPNISSEFKNWTIASNCKFNKMNLTQFLKNKNIKLSNSNKDKIINDKTEL